MRAPDLYPPPGDTWNPLHDYGLLFRSMRAGLTRTEVCPAIRHANKTAAQCLDRIYADMEVNEIVGGVGAHRRT